MAKKEAKAEKKVLFDEDMDEFEPLPVVEVEEVPAPVVDTVKEKAAQITALFAEITELNGAALDTQSADGKIVAAFLVGSRGLLRR